MEELLVIENAYAYGISLHRARRFSEVEKEKYTKWFAEKGLVGIGEVVDLPFVRWNDMPQRKCDGEFLGCSNSAWIITQDEWDGYVALNAQRAAANAEKERAEEIERVKRIIAACERQRDLPTKTEAARRMKEYNNLYNEGGEGYVPYIYSSEDYERAKSRLAELCKVE